MSGPDTSLSEIRNEIDGIDDGIVELLVRRAAAQARVRSQKAAAGTLVQSPIRPAREAQILRRLLGRAEKRVDPDLLVRLWRLIFTTSALSQAPIHLHAGRNCLSEPDMLELVATHFGPMPRIFHDSEDDAIAAVARNTGELAVVRSNGTWSRRFMNGTHGEARVIGMLPVLADGRVPPLLLIGHAAVEPSGADCTIVLGRQALDDGALWSCPSADGWVTCLSGFRPAADSQLNGVVVAGRVPAQIGI